MSLLYVSAREDVKKGDLVMTSGLGGIFPEGVRVGTVARVGIAENGLMKELSVKPAVDFRSLEDVMVYLPAGSGRGPRMPQLEATAPDSLPAPAPAPSSGPAPSAPAPRPATPSGSPANTPSAGGTQASAPPDSAHTPLTR